MKTNHLLQLLSTVIILFSGCHRKPENSAIPTIVFRSSETIDMGELLGRVRFVQLENKPESAFTDIDKLIVSGASIFMLDKRLEAVFCFDTSGHFRYRIQRVGHGPGEYTELDAMWVEPAKHELWLQSFVPARIIVYSYEGQFIREMSVRWPARDMIGLGNSLIAGYNSTRSNDGTDSLSEGIFLLDRKGRSLGQALCLGDTSIYWSLANQRNLEEYEGGALLLSQSDTLFRITPEGKVQPDIRLDWGNLSYPFELRGICYNSPRAGEALRGNYISGKDQLIAFGPIRIFRIFTDGRMELALADKRTGAGIHSTTLSSRSTRIPLVYPLAKTDSGELVGMYDIDLLLAMKESRTSRPEDTTGAGVYREMDTMVDKALSCDRPVLWFAAIKKENLTN